MALPPLKNSKDFQPKGILPEESLPQKAPSEGAMEELVTIERLVPGGHGLARLQSGRVSLLRRVHPGERVKLIPDVIAQHKKAHEDYCSVAPSPAQEPSPCPIVKACGGCDLMGLAVSNQEAIKLGIVRDALRRTANWDCPPEKLRFHSSKQTLAYRHRARFALDSGSQFSFGFRRAASHDIVDVQHCSIISPLLNQGLEKLRQQLKNHENSQAIIEEIELRSQEEPARLTLLPKFKKGASRAQIIAWCQQISQEFELYAPEYLPNSKNVRHKIQLSEDCSISISAGGFTQVNHWVNQAMIAKVMEEAQQCQAKDFLDLFCGAGNFSFPLASMGLSGHGVESNASAIRSAKREAQKLGFAEKLSFRCANAFQLLSEDTLRPADIVIVDPPRQGLAKAVSGSFRLPRKKLILISCDPVSFARELANYRDAHFTLESCHLFDMFPQTHHIESMAVLLPPA